MKTDHLHQLISDNEMDEDTHAKLQSYKFNKQTSPLWCVKLKAKPDSPNAALWEGVPGYPYVYSLFLGINHAITDGTTNTIICIFLVQILEDVLAGKYISDKDQLEVFVSDEKTKEVIKEQMTFVKRDPELYNTLVGGY